MRIWAQAKRFRDAKAAGHPITWEEAARQVAAEEAELERQRAIDKRIFIEDYEANMMNVGPALRSKEN